MLAETLIAETLIGTGAFATGGLVYAQSRRARRYRELASRIAQITRAGAPDLAVLASRRWPGFADRPAGLPALPPAPALAAPPGEAAARATPPRPARPAPRARARASDT